MLLRTVLLAVLGTLYLAVPPALAATTEQEKLEKKVARYAYPVDAVDFAKPRGLCTCPGDSLVLPGHTGILVYNRVIETGGAYLKVSCLLPFFDPAGVASGGASCNDWTLLSR